MRFACAVKGCTRMACTRGWCTLHYQRWLAHGDPNTVLAYKPGSPEAVTFNDNHRWNFTAKHWKRWQRARDPEHPHCQHLARGIDEFRRLLQ